MTFDPAGEIAYLREELRRLRALIEPLLNSDGTVRASSITGTQIHKHSGGNDGGPLGPTKLVQYIDVKEEAAPGNPPAGYVRVYAKSDGRLYSKDDAGVESGPL